MTADHVVLVGRGRVERWYENFARRHGHTGFRVERGSLVAVGEDGENATASLPFARVYDGPADPRAFCLDLVPPGRWGVLLVRKGGFAVAVLTGDRLQESKVGRRHVQGRTKAGGQSQQRFARRRENQAREAYSAAAEHAHRLLLASARELSALVCGGDRAAVEAVLADPRLSGLSTVRVGPWLPVPDPRRGVLGRAVSDAQSVRIRLSHED